MTKRPHTATVRLTENQHRLAKERFAREPGMTFQKLLTAAVNAYVHGDFRVLPNGTYTIESPGAISFEDDGEAEDLLGLDAHEGRPSGRQTTEVWGTRQLAEFAEQTTGRRVSLQLLRALLRERFPQGSDGPGTRYRWVAHSDEAMAVVNAIADGALEEMKRTRLGDVKRRRST